ncbi:NAD kinase [Microbacterium amylolyticum]|uniref:NAD kinase n=1 Tax=Microbacterium amylolyticum TaxID=936337 RepID=A0ABS4ZFV0_9MICO|nr:NAD kinase [Microbacterium amylolyticum]MBP2436097.1 NAD+ kinase [Microbacterium amylolyticum]
MSGRSILIVAHAYRDDTVEAAARIVSIIREQGATPVFAEDDREELSAIVPDLRSVRLLGIDVPLAEIDAAIVLGGDGTILRAAELVRGGTAPILGINMGHVGFLAEIERDDMDDAVDRILAGDYGVEERLALNVRVRDRTGEVVYETWALNEASIEKDSRERMIELVIEIDGRPLSAFGADGCVIATPTGSTAYSFSAGGPVIWPSVQAIVVVPLSAHALFARPLVVGPEHAVAVELASGIGGSGILWCDGRRSHPLPPGARVSVRRAETPVRLARLHPAAFTDRLVRKFQLPVQGWRGPMGPTMTSSVKVIPETGPRSGAEEESE